MRSLLAAATLVVTVQAPAEPVNLSSRTCDLVDPAWSRDGRQIFYYSNCGIETQSGWQMEVMNADGTHARAIPGRADFRPRPSPDGKRIAFDSFRDGDNHEVYVANHDGTQAVRLTQHPGYDVGADWSPDGTWLVFSSGAHRLDMSRPTWYGESDLWVMRPDGTDRRKLTSNPGDDIYPIWSPDGKRIAFTSWRDGNAEIYVMSADGSNQRRLTRSPAREGSPRWSPDGRFIAFTSDRTGNNDVWVMLNDGSHATNITRHPANDADGSWSPDGRSFVFASRRDGNFDLYRIPAKEAEPRERPAFKPIQASAAPVNVTAHAGADLFGTWSPDGRAIVFQSDRNPSAPYRDSALYWMNLDTGEVMALPHGFADARPSLSRDGTKIVFESERDGDVDLYVLDLTLFGVRKVMDEGGNQVIGRWSPDGRSIAYTGPGHGGANDVWIADADGSNRRNVTDAPAADTTPSWSPDGRKLAFTSDRDGNAEIYVLEIETGAISRVTTNAAPDLLPAWSPDGERIAYTSVTNGNSDIMILDVRTGSSTNVTNHPAFDHHASWSPDGCSLLFTSKRTGDLDLWLIRTCPAT